jgi:hypothetical protein
LKFNVQEFCRRKYFSKIFGEQTLWKAANIDLPARFFPLEK